MRRPGVGSDRLKGLRRVNQDGKRYVYHRASGTRLPDLPENHPTFLKAYLDAENDAPKRQGKGSPGSLLAVWHSYCTSDSFRHLSTSYKRVRHRDGDKIMQGGGHVPIIQMRHTHIRADLGPLGDNPANERLKTWRALMGFALEQNFIQEDPTLSIKRRKTAKATPHAVWPVGDILAFRSNWGLGTTQRLAFELLHFTGARISDVVRMGDGQIDNEGWLTFRQQKTGGRVTIPFNRPLPFFAKQVDLDHLKAALAARPSIHMTWITTASGSSRSQKSASQWFSAATRAAGIEGGKSAHDLRATRAVSLAEAGATTHQIGAWTGHESLKEIDHYSRQANKKRLLDGPDREQKLFRDCDPEQNNPASN